jgi:hypothetical protein
MPELPLPLNLPPKVRALSFNLPLRIRGIKGVTSIIFITPLPLLSQEGNSWES